MLLKLTTTVLAMIATVNGKGDLLRGASCNVASQCATDWSCCGKISLNKDLSKKARGTYCIPPGS